MDYTQYYLNLTKANLENETKWEIEYNYANSYKVDDASAESMHSVLMKLKKPDNRVFNQYINYFTVGHHSETKCNYTCKLSHVCSIEYIKTSDYVHCLNQTLKDLYFNRSHHHHKIKPQPIHPVHGVPTYVYYTVGGLVCIAVVLLIFIVLFCYQNRAVYGSRLHQGYVRVSINV